MAQRQRRIVELSVCLNMYVILYYTAVLKYECLKHGPISGNLLQHNCCSLDEYKFLFSTTLVCYNVKHQQNSL